MADEVRFWSLKRHIQYWIDKNGLKYVVAIGATRGSRVAELCLIGNEDSDEFVEKHKMIETEYMHGWFTKNGLSKKFISVSCRKR